MVYPANRKPKSGEILMFVGLQNGAKQCCDATKFHRSHCAGQRTTCCWPVQWGQLSLVVSQHCLAYFLGETSIISLDLGSLKFWHCMRSSSCLCAGMLTVDQEWNRHTDWCISSGDIHLAIHLAIQLAIHLACWHKWMPVSYRSLTNDITKKFQM